jgi:hypothetical protein
MPVVGLRPIPNKIDIAPLIGGMQAPLILHFGDLPAKLSIPKWPYDSGRALIIHRVVAHGTIINHLCIKKV